MTAASFPCPACGNRDLEMLLEFHGIPVQSCVLLDTSEAARSYPTGDLRLWFCHECGFGFNDLYDPDLVDYGADTEESQHFSGTFSRFAKALITEFSKSFDLRDRLVLEIGCGKGDFLLDLVQSTGARGVGIDPGVSGRGLDIPTGLPIEFRREYFDPAKVDFRPDFIVCRHMLEHHGPVGEFIASVSELAVTKGSKAVLFEVPDFGRVLREGAYWDIYYEHCSYFSPGSLEGLFGRNGFNPTNVYTTFSDQYLILYAEPGQRRLPPTHQLELERLQKSAEGFPEQVARQWDRWTAFVHNRRDTGKSIVLWGGSSKAVSFLTTHQFTADEIRYVVDINPFKQGKFLPGSGHLVTGPETLSIDPADTVIVMNGIYQTEISETLAELGLNPEIVSL